MLATDMSGLGRNRGGHVPRGLAPHAGQCARQPAASWAPDSPGRGHRARLEAMPSPTSAAHHIQDLAAFVTASPSSYHAGRGARRLDAAGFTRLDECGLADDWDGAAGSTSSATAR